MDLDPAAKQEYDKAVKDQLIKDIVKVDKETGEKTLDKEQLDKIDYADAKLTSPKLGAKFFGISESTLLGKNPLDSKNTTKGDIKIKDGRRSEEGSEAYNLNKKLYEISEEYAKLLNTTQLQPKDIIREDIKKLEEKYKETGSERDKKALDKRKAMMKAQDGQRAGDQSKQGTSLNIDPSIIKKLYEKTDIRSMGKGSQPYVQTAKGFDAKTFREKAGIVNPKDFVGKNEAKTAAQKKALRNQSTLNTALARNYLRMVEGKMRREALEELKEEYQDKEIKQIIDKAIREEFKGASKFSASQKSKMDVFGKYDFYNPKQVAKARKVIIEKYAPIFGPDLMNRMFRDLTPGGGRAEKLLGKQIAIRDIDALESATRTREQAVEKLIKKGKTKKEALKEVEQIEKLEQQYISNNKTLLENDLILNISELSREIKKAGLQENIFAKTMLEAFGKGQKFNRLGKNIDNLKEYKKATELLIDKFKEAYDKDPKAAGVLREFIYNNKASGMLGKDVALMRGKHEKATDKNKYEEHTYPFSSWAIRTMDAIKSKNPKVL